MKFLRKSLRKHIKENSQSRIGISIFLETCNYDGINTTVMLSYVLWVTKEIQYVIYMFTVAKHTPKKTKLFPLFFFWPKTQTQPPLLRDPIVGCVSFRRNNGQWTSTSKNRRTMALLPSMFLLRTCRSADPFASASTAVAVFASWIKWAISWNES